MSGTSSRLTDSTCDKEERTDENGTLCLYWVCYDSDGEEVCCEFLCYLE